MRVASFFPFQSTYYLNGHSFIEQELNRAGVGFRKNDNAFLAVDDPAALQAAADRLNPALIRERLDYWTLLLGPKFSAKEQARISLRRFYAISQIEYCRNFIFKRHFPIHKIFQRSCELGLWRLSTDKISQVFGTRITKKLHGKLASTWSRLSGVGERGRDVPSYPDQASHFTTRSPRCVSKPSKSRSLCSSLYPSARQRVAMMMSTVPRTVTPRLRSLR